ncbi:IS110 family transposase [Amycolatopsis sp. WQ 127309]|uniref:IS110 family transposase n=1 Tax=Amycolatopsis sp. WQ 127309 TaxID=2932773 RepID=UPI001FF68F92|nr:IS110 family transposase [Amycolatopsis sp. WQ 127309]UOZ03294.1 IS110 family transposase [Amycolatopsis sp. WQ 127309]
MPSTPRLTSPQVLDGQEVIVEVDTHKDLHVAAVVTAFGVLLASKAFPTTPAGYQALVKWAREFGAVRRAGVECTGSYGAALARHLAAVDIEVFEVNQPDKANRRRRGKNDAIDAESAARSVLNGQTSGLAKGGQGPVEMLRMFKVAKTSALKSRTQAINQLKAVLVSADPALREELRDLSTAKLVQRCVAWAPATPTDSATAARYTLRVLACRIDRLSQEIADLNAQTAAVLTGHNSAMLDTYGVGPDTAATLLIAAGDNPERLRSEASFAALCGVSPVEASSGRTATPPAQPRRRPPGQLRPALHRAGPPALGPTHPRLHRPACPRGQNQTRSRPLPQTLHRPRVLPDHHLTGLTDRTSSARCLTNNRGIETFLAVAVSLSAVGRCHQTR